jgi:hypothetical protein
VEENPLLARHRRVAYFPLYLFCPPLHPLLQWLYNNHIGSTLEVLYQDGPEMLRLGLRSGALAKESVRTAQQLGRKFWTDPVGASSDVISLTADCVLHPLRTLDLAKKFVDPALKASWESFKFALWIKEPSGETPP